jgi:hypothetical protein
VTLCEGKQKYFFEMKYTYKYYVTQLTTDVIKHVPCLKKPEINLDMKFTATSERQTTHLPAITKPI